MKKLYYSILLILLALSLTLTSSARSYYRSPLPPGAIGHETIVFDLNGGGPYVGVSDGRILRFDQTTCVWMPFAAMPTWYPRCVSVNEPGCGRPLGLRFHPTTGDLYVAYAYHGLVVVGRGSSRGVSVETSAKGIQFRFTNSLDINEETGVVYFSDSTTRFRQSEFGSIIATGDNTERLISYNPYTRVVSVLQDNLRFPNGVALSDNMDYLLFSETTTDEIHTSGRFMTARGRLDNINRASDGKFWIAQVPLPLGGSGSGGMPLKVNEKAQVLSRRDAASGELVTSASVRKEFGGRLWIGNVISPFIEVASP